MLLIISAELDDSVGLVMPKLKARGVPVLWWDEADFPEHTLINVELLDGNCHQTLTYRGVSYDLAEITAVWHRRPGPPSASSVTHPTHRVYAEEAARRVLDGVYDLMPADRWMPARPKEMVRVDDKLLHLRRAMELGFAIPDTVVSNDPEQLVPVWRRAGGRLIAKSIDHRPFSVREEEHQIYTTRVDRRDLAGRHRIRHSPVILQPNLAKTVELRATVVGDQVFTAQIDSQSSRLTRQDWRHYEDVGVAYAPHRLPAEVEERCVRLVASLGLSFGAIDLILTPGGEYVFVELNVTGQWGFVELLTGLPISDAIAEWLAKKGSS